MTKKSISGTLSTKAHTDKKNIAKPSKEAAVLKKAMSLHGAGKLRIHPHANERMGQRNIIEYELLQALSSARHIPAKDRFSSEHGSWEYCLQGKTLDGRPLRMGVTFEKDSKTNEYLLVITVIDITRK